MTPVPVREESTAATSVPVRARGTRDNHEETAVPCVAALTADDRRGLFVELVRTLRLKRRPLTAGETKAVQLAQAGVSSKPRAHRRILSALSREAKRHRFETSPLDPECVEWTAGGTEEELLDALLGVKATVAGEIKAAPQADPEGDFAEPLPLTAARAEKLAPMTADRVATVAIPWNGRKPERAQTWGRPLKPDELPLEQRQALRDLLEKERLIGAISRVTSIDEVKLVTPVYCLVQGGKHRLIHDCRALNVRLRHMSVVYSSVTEVAKMNGKFATKLDLLNAFKHVGIELSDRALMCFQVGRSMWRWNTLSFGMAASPALFEQALKPALDALKAKGLKFIVYVDDFLVIADSPAELDAATVEVIDVLESNGWRLSKKKVIAGAHRAIVFLGLRVEIQTGRLTVPPSKANKLRALCDEALGRRLATTTALQRIIGLLNWFAIAVPIIGAMTRALVGAAVEAERLPGRHVHRRGLLDEELRWWSRNASLITMWEGRVRTDGSVSITLVTDASADGVGGLAWRGNKAPDLDGWVRDVKRSSRVQAGGTSDDSIGLCSLGVDGDEPGARQECAFDEKAKMSSPNAAGEGVGPPICWPWLMAGALSTTEIEESSAVRELLALLRSLQNLEKEGWFTMPTLVCWFSDSSAGTRAIEKWRTKSSAVGVLLSELWALCARLRVEVRPQWIGRDSGWLPAADWLSRVVGRAAQAEWSLPDERFAAICEELGAPTLRLDVFATADNAKCEAFRSRFPEPGSEGCAFADPWSVAAYAFPPFSQAGRCVDHWRRGPQCPLVLVLPAGRKAQDALGCVARLGLIRRSSRQFAVPLVDHAGAAAPRTGPWLIAVLLEQHRDERCSARPGPMK